MTRTIVMILETTNRRTGAFAFLRYCAPLPRGREYCGRSAWSLTALPMGLRTASWRPAWWLSTSTAPSSITTAHFPNPFRRQSAMVLDADVPVVLATGRSWHGTQPVFDELGRFPDLRWLPTVRWSSPTRPQEIRKAVTFDPREVIKKVVQFAPGTLIAVEEIGWLPSQ